MALPMMYLAWPSTDRTGYANWLGKGIHPEPVQEHIEQQLTPETRLAILRIKDAWYQLPAYRQEVYSTDIYDAVLQHGVRTLTEFDDYLAQRGKSTRAKN